MSPLKCPPLLLTPYGRLRFVRSMTGLSRPAIEHKYHLPEITLKKWETGKLPLTPKGISRCILIYKQEGIIVTASWLLHGIGPLPYFSSFISNIKSALDEDISYFKNHYPNTVIYCVDNEDMLPKYKPKDIVIGFSDEQNLETYNKSDCIVVLSNGKTILRQLILSANGKINLVCYNSMRANSIMTDVKIISATPVKWHKIHLI